MPKKGHTEQQIVAALRQAEVYERFQSGRLAYTAIAERGAGAG